MSESLKSYISNLSLGQKQQYKNLVMVPLIGSSTSALDYLLLDEALQQKLAEINEVSQGGSVPDLKVVNKAGRMLLLLDGEEIVGAKQNRIINTTILIAAAATTVIPVSCVEQGRWSYTSSHFTSHGRVMSSEMRASKAEQILHCVCESGEYRADQGAIWDAIDDKASRRNARSGSMAMSSIYDKDRGSLEEYRQHFAMAEGQAGALFLINGKIAGLDIFDKAETFAKVFMKLLDSYSLDAIDWYDPKKQPSNGQDPNEFLQALAQATVMSNKAVALGEDLRFESEKLSGFALIYAKAVVHLAAFAKTAEHKYNHASMQRFSGRQNRII